MADPRFRETVVLLIEYSGNGAMGLIINRPTEVKLSTLFPGIKDLQRRSETAFIGGPVEMEKCFMLIRSGVAPEDSLHVFSDVYVSTSMRVLQQIAKGGKRGEKFRLYVGYTGWGTGQLQRELSRGQWRILEADPKIVFENDPGKIWQDLIRRSSGVLVRHGQSGSESPTSRKGGGPSLRQSPS
jgi:putative transcriptional regulator